MSKLGILQLLRQVYGDVLMPPAVWREIVDSDCHPESDDVRAAADAGWLQVRPCPSPLIASPENEPGLDQGEAEAISLAKETGSKLIIDERMGREVARRFGVPVVGTVGVFLEAKKAGVIDAIQPWLVRLRDETSFRLSSKVFDLALELAGESIP